MSQRDHNIRLIRTIGRRRWQKESGYTRRSLVETAIYRYKTIIGRRLRARTLSCQRTEVRIALCHHGHDDTAGNARGLLRGLNQEISQQQSARADMMQQSLSCRS